MTKSPCIRLVNVWSATVEKNAILYNNVDGKQMCNTVQIQINKRDYPAEWGGKNSFTYGLDASKYDVSLKDNHKLCSWDIKRRRPFVLTAPMMVDSAGATSNALTRTQKG